MNDYVYTTPFQPPKVSLENSLIMQYYKAVIEMKTRKKCLKLKN